jgi:hypothetical protein
MTRRLRPHLPSLVDDRIGNVGQRGQRQGLFRLATGVSRLHDIYFDLGQSCVQAHAVQLAAEFGASAAAADDFTYNEQ